jgi:ABC-type Fe3+ transport system permease subunit
MYDFSQRRRGRLQNPTHFIYFFARDSLGNTVHLCWVRSLEIFLAENKALFVAKQNKEKQRQNKSRNVWEWIKNIVILVCLVWLIVHVTKIQLFWKLHWYSDYIYNHCKRRRTYNTMAKRRRTYNTMTKRRRTYNTMTKRRRTYNTMVLLAIVLCVLLLKKTTIEFGKSNLLQFYNILKHSIFYSFLIHNYQ